MTVCENFEKGKLIEKKIDHVLDLVKIDLGSLEGCLIYKEHYQAQHDRLHEPESKETYDLDGLLYLHNIAIRQIGFYDKIFKKNAKDLYEFFYDEKATEKNGYYWFQFPIDLKEFRKKRAPRKKIELALKNKEKNGKQICKLMRQNAKVFFEIVQRRKK